MGLKDDRKAQAARLRAAREAKGWPDATTGALYIRANKDTYIQHENGTRSFMGAVLTYAERLDVTPEWLLWGRSAPSDNAASAPLFSMPVISWATAGKLGDPSTQIPEVDAPLIVLNGLESGNYFATRVDGDSMNIVSPEGSTIIVNRSEIDLIPGRAYIFSHRGKTTYKRWQDDPPRLQPYSTNPANEAIFPKSADDWDVVGRVRRTIFDL